MSTPMMSSPYNRELVYLVLQYLDEERFKETARMLEKESGMFLNMNYVEFLVRNGEWNELEKYLLAFMKIDDNRYTMKLFFEIRKVKYLEALDRNENAYAVEILRKELRGFSSLNEDIFKEIVLLLSYDNFRECEPLSTYGDIKFGRILVFQECKRLIESNPNLSGKLQFPVPCNSRLRTLINQGLNWQHQLCRTPRPNPEVKSLLMDHKCEQPNDEQVPAPVCNQPVVHSQFRPAAATLMTPPGGWMASTSPVPYPVIPGGPVTLTTTDNANSGRKRSRTVENSEEVNNLPNNVSPDAHEWGSQSHILVSPNVLPKTVVACLNQGSAVKTIDFHPVHEMILLVGTNIGDIAVWEIGKRESLAFRKFRVWFVEACSKALKASLTNGQTLSVNRVIWSPDGSLFGVAYSKHIVHVYSFESSRDIRNQLEIDAHDGIVSDLAFSNPNNQLCLVTCGDDKLVKVWDAVTGCKLFTFEGHEAPVYSVCPHVKQGIQFIFSSAVDGKIKAWLYDDLGPRVDYTAPGNSCTRMLYSAGGTRLFSCGTGKDGESHIVEWDENEGIVKKRYLGLGKRSAGVVQFDTKNRFLVAGDEHVIKFWDIDNVNLLAFTNAEGGLLASPCIKLSKQGKFLAVSTSENGVKILGNDEGIRMVSSIGNREVDASRVSSESVIKSPTTGANGANGASSSSVATAAGVSKIGTTVTAIVPWNGDVRTFTEVNRRITTEMGGSKIWRLTQIDEQAQLRFLRLRDSFLAARVSRLIYTNSEDKILSLSSNAVHKIWKWANGKATTNVQPAQWKPQEENLLVNEISEKNPENAIPCCSLSKNDSYLVSANGGKLSLYNLASCQTMAKFMSSKPAATSLAFNPQDNNFIAVGMEDGSIQMYSVRIDEVQTKLLGHQAKVTGLAFSNKHILVSSGADAKLCVWNTDNWREQGSRYLHIPPGRASSPHAHTRVQFHQDGTHVMAVHDTQIAIYDATKLELIKQWIPRESSGRITDATYSCDSKLIYVCVEDANIFVLVGSSLRMRCRISPSAYLPQEPSSSSSVYPVVIAGHPTLPNQIAVGHSNGQIYVLEPLASEGEWGSEPPRENGATATKQLVPPINPQQPSPHQHIA